MTADGEWEFPRVGKNGANRASPKAMQVKKVPRVGKNEPKSSKYWKNKILPQRHRGTERESNGRL